MKKFLKDKGGALEKAIENLENDEENLLTCLK